MLFVSLYHKSAEKTILCRIFVSIDPPPRVSRQCRNVDWWMLLVTLSVTSRLYHAFSADMLWGESEEQGSLCKVLDLVRYVALVLRELMRELGCDLDRFVDIVDDLDPSESYHASDSECPLSVVLPCSVLGDAE